MEILRTVQWKDDKTSKIATTEEWLACGHVNNLGLPDRTSGVCPMVAKGACLNKPNISETHDWLRMRELDQKTDV